MRCNGVFEGGGVRGIGHVGAACGMEEGGYRFVNLAGSSAGAIVAALLAAGYGCQELKRELSALDYRKFMGKDLLDCFGAAGKVLSIFLTLGIYHTGYLEEWMDELLGRKKMRRFGDVKEGGRTLKITASDLTKRRLFVFPDDLKACGLEADSFPIARAVRMSVSIPVFFEPVRWRDGNGERHLMVDGGLLSNYPMWVLDDGKTVPKWPTFGFRFMGEGEGEAASLCPENPDLLEYLKAIVSTSLDAFDNSHVSAGDFERTIRIPTTVKTGGCMRKIGAVDFDIEDPCSQGLFENGREAARQFLRTWDFERWKARYRGQRDEKTVKSAHETMFLYKNR